MNIPAEPSINYVAIILFLIGLFLFVSGLNIIKVEKITVSQGYKAWIVGLLLMLGGASLGVGKISIEYNKEIYDKTQNISNEYQEELLQIVKHQH